MGEILKLRLRPLIRVERVGVIWAVTVRPCPLDFPSMKACDSERAAADHANELREKFGWPIRPGAYDYSRLTDAPGAA